MKNFERGAMNGNVLPSWDEEQRQNIEQYPKAPLNDHVDNLGFNDGLFDSEGLKSVATHGRRMREESTAVIDHQFHDWREEHQVYERTHLAEQTSYFPNEQRRKNSRKDMTPLGSGLNVLSASIQKGWQSGKSDNWELVPKSNWSADSGDHPCEGSVSSRTLPCTHHHGRHDPSWPYAPGLPVVESKQEVTVKRTSKASDRLHAATTTEIPSSSAAADPGKMQQHGANFASQCISTLSYNHDCFRNASSDANSNSSAHYPLAKRVNQDRSRVFSPSAAMVKETVSQSSAIATQECLTAKSHFSIAPQNATKSGRHNCPIGLKRPGVSPALALRTIGHLLMPSEKLEILNYEEIWFAGRAGIRKIRHSAHDLESNGGYDDARGDYIAIIGDHVAFRYEILGCLGRGSFGQVLKCLDHATGSHVALKIIKNKRRFQKQAKVEAGILRDLGDQDPENACGIVQMHDFFSFRSHLCITFELLAANLYDQIKAGGFVGFPSGVVCQFATQILKTLSLLRSVNIIHADIKPENMCLAAPGSSVIKIIDFGSSCYANQRVYSYIQSRFYRAPEVILGLPYGPAIDMWSLACVLPELMTGQPLFPGEDETEQLACMMEILGVVPSHLLGNATRAKLFFDPVSLNPKVPKPNSRGKIRFPGTQTLRSVLGRHGNPAFIDFLQLCLRWDPSERLHPDEALRHPWLAERSFEGRGSRERNGSLKGANGGANESGPGLNNKFFRPLGRAIMG